MSWMRLLLLEGEAVLQSMQELLLALSRRWCLLVGSDGLWCDICCCGFVTKTPSDKITYLNRASKCSQPGYNSYRPWSEKVFDGCIWQSRNPTKTSQINSRRIVLADATTFAL